MNTKCLPCRRAGTRIKKVNEHFWECSGERNGVSIWCNTIDRLLPEPHTQSLKVWLKERMKRMRRSLLLQKPQCLMTWRNALMMAAKTAEINDSSSTGIKSITATPRAPAQIQPPNFSQHILTQDPTYFMMSCGATSLSTFWHRTQRTSWCHAEQLLSAHSDTGPNVLHDVMRCNFSQHILTQDPTSFMMSCGATSLSTFWHRT